MFNKKLLFKEDMMKIFHDPENIPYNLVESYYKLAKDIYGGPLHENYLLFKSLFPGVTGFVDIISILDDKLKELIQIRYGLTGNPPLTYKAIGELYGFSYQAAQKNIAKALRILRNYNNSQKCTIFYAKKQLKVLLASLDQPANFKVVNNLNNSLFYTRHPDTPIEEMKLSVRSYNCLKRSNINTIGELLALSHDDIYKIRNLGYRSANEIWQKLYGKDFYS